MTTEEFLRGICPNHTDKSKWNKSELLHILELQKEQLRLHIVSQQREQLMSFMKWIDDNNHTCIKREHWVDDYLEAINCL